MIALFSGAGWLQKNLSPHLTVLQQEAENTSTDRSVRQYRLSAQPDQNVRATVHLYFMFVQD